MLHPQIDQINQLILDQLKTIKTKINNIEIDKTQFNYDNIKCSEILYILTEHNTYRIGCVINCGENNIEFEKYLDLKLKSLLGLDIQTFTE